MSLWGMNDGATLTGKSTWTNDDATLADGATGTNSTYVTDGVEVGDCLVGSDGLLYRVVTVTSETALEVDRVYEGSTAANEDITRMKLPRHIKITNDDGTGMTLQDLGIFGITDAERSAGVDNLSAVGEVLVGSCHRTVPAVTVAAPPTNTIATASVNTTDNTITVANHGFRTGTKLNYLNGTGSNITGLTETAWYVIAKETTIVEVLLEI